MYDRNKITKRILNFNESILFALKKMDSTGLRSLLILDKENSYFGILSIGDIQRAILKDIPLESPIQKILRSNPKIASPDTPFDKIKAMMLQHRMEFLPVVDHFNQVVEVYFWDDVFGEEQHLPITPFNLPVVIMAGGIGTRLKPLTYVLPKPLIPIADKTMLEEIFERFNKYGCNSFYVSINYKADLIEYYIRNQKLPYDIHYLREEKLMGTAGCLSLLKGQINETFFVSNCDILIEQDYWEMLDYHIANKNEITIIAALKHFPISYGTIESGINGKLLKIVEKPDLTLKINSGMYILEPHLLDEIPENVFFHITQLIERVKERKGNIGVFPVSEKSWKDMGSWDELIQHFGKLK